MLADRTQPGDQLGAQLHGVSGEDITRLPNRVVDQFDVPVQDIAADVFDQAAQVANGYCLYLEMGNGQRPQSSGVFKCKLNPWKSLEMSLNNKPPSEKLIKSWHKCRNVYYICNWLKGVLWAFCFNVYFGNVSDNKAELIKLNVSLVCFKTAYLDGGGPAFLEVSKIRRQSFYSKLHSGSLSLS